MASSEVQNHVGFRIVRPQKGRIMNTENNPGAVQHQPGKLDFLIVESLAFVIIGLFSYIYLWFKKKQPYNPFRKTESVRWSSGIMELLGNVCYTYAVASNPVLATPITSSYCIVTIIAARILLKERLQKKQYICLAILVAGILLLGISDVMK